MFGLLELFLLFDLQKTDFRIEIGAVIECGANQ